MARWKTKEDRRLRRRLRTRKKISGESQRPRLTVRRSLSQIYAQLVDDASGRTLAQASTVAKEVRGRLEGAKTKSDQSRIVGRVLAERAKSAGIKRVTFDRGGYLYHGRVKALAEGAREGGLEF